MNRLRKKFNKWLHSTCQLEIALAKLGNRELRKENDEVRARNRLYRNIDNWAPKLEELERITKKLIRAHQQSANNTKKLMRLFADYEGLQSRLLRAECGLQTKDEALNALRFSLSQIDRGEKGK